MRPPSFRDRRDRIRQLHIFCEVARAGSISQASEFLGLTQPAVSLQIRELEHELGAILLERQSTGVSVTPAGRHLLALAEPLVKTVGELFDNVSQGLTDTEAGERVRVAVSHAGAAFVLPRFVRQFRDRDPDTLVRLVIAQQPEGLKLLLAGRVDLVCAPLESHPGTVHYEELLTYSLVFIAPLEHPLARRGRVSPEEAVRHGVIVPALGTFSHRIGESGIRAIGLDASPRMEVGGWGEVKRYVEAGLGVGVIPNLCLRAADRLSVAALDADLPEYSYGVFVQRDQLLAPAARNFLEVLAPDAPGSILAPER